MSLSAGKSGPAAPIGWKAGRSLSGLALGLALISLATLLGLAFKPVLGDNSLFIELAAVVLSAFYGRLWVAILVASLAVVSYNYFHQFPLYKVTIINARQAAELGIFWVTALVVSAFGARLRSAKLTAERATQSREEVIAIVSHDLKNPLSAIQTGAALLLASPDLPKPLARKAAQGIQNSAGRMDRLIRDLLDYEKVRAGRVEIRCRPISAVSLLDAVDEAMSLAAGAKGIRIEKRVIGSDFRLECDPDRMLQVFSNLVGNAIKFSPAGSRVIIQARLARRAGVFSVEDHGPGISKEHLPRIFDRYWQAQGTAHLGTGLGLAIAKGIVDAHHGEIRVSSRLGKGTLFMVILPIRSPSAGHVQTAA